MSASHAACGAALQPLPLLLSNFFCAGPSFALRARLEVCDCRSGCQRDIRLLRKRACEVEMRLYVSEQAHRFRDCLVLAIPHKDRVAFGGVLRLASRGVIPARHLGSGVVLMKNELPVRRAAASFG